MPSVSAYMAAQVCAKNGGRNEALPLWAWVSLSCVIIVACYVVTKRKK